MNKINSTNNVSNIAQNIIDDRIAKNQERYDAEQLQIQKISYGLNKILGNNASSVLDRMPDYTRRRWGGRVEQTNEMKVKSLIRAVVHDYKLVKCVRISEKVERATGRRLDMTELKRTNNEILAVIENLAER